MDSFLKTEQGKKISYRYLVGKKGFTFLFMHGTLSDKNASKSFFIEDYCKKNELGFVAFDFEGHGQSSGEYTDATIGSWLENALEVVDNVSKDDNLVLVGSSMGGWISLLVAQERPERVGGLVGLAAAPDFTVDLWEGFSQEQRNEINKKGVIYIPNGWTEKGDPWTKALFEEAEKHLLLNKKEGINITCPVTLIQGMKDDCVPMETSLKLMRNIKSDNVKVVLLKNSGHRLSEPDELLILEKELLSFIN